MGTFSIHRLLEVPATDPEDARRRKLLNILLAGLAVLGLMIVIATGIADLLNLLLPGTGTLYIYGAGIVFLGGAVIIYYINRKISGTLASVICLLLISLILPFSDTPIEVADGQSLFIFTIPIIMSSVLLRPYASFIFATLSSIEIALIALAIPIVPNLPAMGGYYMVALISWLAARSLEDALRELMIINRDLDKIVADRTQALTQALARERAEAGKNQAILEGIADGVVVFDPEHRAIVVNPAVKELTGLAADEVLGESFEHMLNAGNISDRECEAALDHLVSLPGGNLKLTWGKKTLTMNASMVRSADGEEIGRVAVFHDFTREAEVERMKSDFVAMVSHELRTPLSSILGYTEMIREGVYGELSGGQISAIDRIMANTRRLLTIVNDLLDQAQIEAGKLKFREREFHPVELLDHLNSVMESLVRAKGLRLITRISDDLPKTLVGDPQRLNQVLVNLVNNAVKFTDHGSIQVRFFLSDKDHWAMEVKDSGIGISKDAQKIVFDPFRQANMDATRQFGGIGLGLSIVKRLVNLMEGEICLNSQEGHGSTFTVILPLKPSEIKDGKQGEN